MTRRDPAADAERAFWRGLLPFVNESDPYNRFQAYISRRIEYLRSQLETELNPDQVRAHQGAIRELRRMQLLREEAVEKAK